MMRTLSSPISIRFFVGPRIGRLFLTDVKKCKVMHVGNGNQRICYYLSGQEFEEVFVERDLGVYINSTKTMC